MAIISVAGTMSVLVILGCRAISGVSSLGAWVDDVNVILKRNNENSDLTIRATG